MKKFNFTEKIKSIGFGKRQLILSCLILLIAVAGYINLNYSGIAPTDSDLSIDLEQEAVPAAAPAVDEFEEMRFERDKTKSESMAVYREIVENDKSSKESRDKAQADLSASAKASENESAIEAVLTAKGFGESIVYITDKAVSVMVKTDGLVPSETAQIKDIVIEHTGVSADMIKIVEKN